MSRTAGAHARLERVRYRFQQSSFSPFLQPLSVLPKKTAFLLLRRHIEERGQMVSANLYLFRRYPFDWRNRCEARRRLRSARGIPNLMTHNDLRAGGRSEAPFLSGRGGKMIRSL